MTGPHEETLTVDERYPSPVLLKDGEVIASFFGDLSTALARARLGAQAPRLARLLLAMAGPSSQVILSDWLIEARDALADAGVLP